MRRPLLILSCSATKREGRGLISAYERYDGPAYRVLRASGFPSAARGPDTRLRILSAEHGLISCWATIDAYDRLMDAERAEQFATVDEDELCRTLFLPVIASKRRDAFEHFPASEVFVWGGKLYRSVVEAWEARGIFDDVPGGVSYSSGGIGTQLGQLKTWLTDHTPSRSGCMRTTGEIQKTSRRRNARPGPERVASLTPEHPA